MDLDYNGRAAASYHLALKRGQFHLRRHFAADRFAALFSLVGRHEHPHRLTEDLVRRIPQKPAFGIVDPRDDAFGVDFMFGDRRILKKATQPHVAAAKRLRTVRELITLFRTAGHKGSPLSLSWCKLFAYINLR